MLSLMLCLMSEIRYLDVVAQYHGVISGQLFAHHHTDSVKLFTSQTSHLPVSLALLVPGVSPMKSTLATETGANNPGLRLVKFNTTSGQGRYESNKHFRLIFLFRFLTTNSFIWIWGKWIMMTPLRCGDLSTLCWSITIWQNCPHSRYRVSCLMLSVFAIYI